MKLLESLIVDGTITPNSDNSKDLGSSTNRWKTIYSGTDIIIRPSASTGLDILPDGIAPLDSSGAPVTNAKLSYDSTNSWGIASTSSGSLDIRVTSQADGFSFKSDASYYAGASSDPIYWIDNTSSTLRAALRFTGISIPQGATITSAAVTVYTNYGTTSVDPSDTVTIALEQVDNAAQCTSGSDAASRLSNLGSTISWAVNNAGGADTPQTSPDLSSILQTIINRTGWSSGNAIQFFTHPTTTAANGDMAMQSYATGTSTTYARLQVSYSTSGSVSSLLTQASSANDLADVAISGPVSEDVLQYNGTNWVNGKITPAWFEKGGDTSNHYMYLGTLPISATGTMDIMYLTITGGNWTGTPNVFNVMLRNRNSLQYTQQSIVGTAAQASNIAIVCYTQGDGSVDVYARLGTATYLVMTVWGYLSGTSAPGSTKEAATRIDYTTAGTPTTTTPSGTLSLTLTGNNAANSTLLTANATVNTTLVIPVK